MTQSEKVLAYMKTNKTGLTSTECLETLGILNFTTKISQLRREGHLFSEIQEEQEKRYFWKGQDEQLSMSFPKPTNKYKAAFELLKETMGAIMPHLETYDLYEYANRQLEKAEKTIKGGYK